MKDETGTIIYVGKAKKLKNRVSSYFMGTLVRPNKKLKRKNIKLFGPYPNSFAAKKIVYLLNRMYPLRKCKNL